MADNAFGECCAGCCGMCCIIGSEGIFSWLQITTCNPGDHQRGCCTGCCKKSFDEDEFLAEQEKRRAEAASEGTALVTQPSAQPSMSVTQTVVSNDAPKTDKLPSPRPSLSYAQDPGAADDNGQGAERAEQHAPFQEPGDDPYASGEGANADRESLDLELPLPLPGCSLMGDDETTEKSASAAEMHN
ncbi:uncharacterized protein LAESUDRAFT_813832 [Laetiporus sulphureus 93-53]|uniref:Uncharacterized protein n=1 Tax=Laetiporus sulphureus 93-53 TaxID=1314785 RepID=A0A165DIJ6_9APHY|nr:uncharacterized protein LAESUDRAFT_813832 [Laetiporus sulphureus 93-53]KZT04958.1 hypothetical protein LAESUDRAFT_813832 [Laetiporus sulphureus 93-53]